MSNDHKKDFLWGYKRAKYELKRAEEDLEEYNTNIIYPASLFDNMPKGEGVKADLSKYMQKLDELQKKCLKRRYLAIKTADEIKNCIMRLENEAEKEVLILRYIKLKQWEEICVKIGYSWKQTHRIHSNALQKLKY